jgi:hypothetical protein
MASRIKPKRSYTANSVPLTSDLDTHELAIRWDTSSPAIFTKNSAGNIVSVALGGGGGGGSSGATLSGSVTIPASGDEYWSNTLLLLRGDGNLADSSSYGRVLTANGAAATSTSTKKYGTGSLSFDGASGSYFSLPSSSDWALSGDFTIEGWAYLDSTSPSPAGLLSTVNTGQSAGGFILGADKFFLSANSFGSGNELNWTFPTNAWTHFAVVNDNGTLRAYLGGTQVATVAKTITIAATSLVIGSRFQNLQSYNWKGFLDDLRITSSCRYANGTSFTPPAAAFATGTYAAGQTLPVTISGTNGMNPFIRATVFGS